MDFPQFSFILFAVLLGAQAQNRGPNCVTPDGQNGRCISLYSCKPVLDIFEKNRDPFKWSSIIVWYNCGLRGANSPRVCCPLEEVEMALEAAPLSGPRDISAHPSLQLLPENCGVLDTEGKILNGNKTGLVEFPWMARLLFKTSEGLQFKCGGTIINEKYILTAAHCINKELVGVRVGDHNYDTPEDCETNEDGEEFCAPPPQDLTIEEAIPHPQFNIKKGVYDIGLLRVNRIDMTKENVRSVCLPLEKVAKVDFTGRFGIVTGWGNTESGTPSPDLLKVNLRINRLEECQKVYAKYASLDSRQFCAGGKTASDSCFGDSGGPFQVVTRLHGDARMVQLGVVSFGRFRKCGRRAPGIYSKVAIYLDWLLNTIRP